MSRQYQNCDPAWSTVGNKKIGVFLLRVFLSAIFENVSNAQKLSHGLQIWTIGSFISQLHVCQVS
jgi:hypothetical protein